MNLNSVQPVTDSMTTKFVPPMIQELVTGHFNQKPPWNEMRKNIPEALEECLRFLYLRSENPALKGRFIPVCDDTDQIWHYLIIQTRFYSELCKNLPSGDFIHHESVSFDQYLENQNNYKDRSLIFSGFLEWIPLYLRHFGGFTQAGAKYWKIMDVLFYQGMSLEEINQLD